MNPYESPIELDEPKRRRKSGWLFDLVVYAVIILAPVALFFWLLIATQSPVRNEVSGPLPVQPVDQQDNALAPAD